MPIEFNCQECQKLLRVPDGSSGKKAQCPSCQTVLEIPAATPPADPFSAPVSKPGDLSAPLPSGGGQSEGASSNMGQGSQGASTGGASPFAGPGSFAPTGQSPPPVPPMSDNPFASPTASSAAPSAFTSAKGPIVPTRIQFNLLERIWKVFSANLGQFLLLGLTILGLMIGLYILLILMVVLAMGLGGGFQGPNPEFGIVSFVIIGFSYLAFLVAGCWIGLGMIRYVLSIARGEQSGLSELFSCGPFLLRGLGIGFFQLITTYGVVFAFMAPGFFTQNELLLVGGQLIGSFLTFPIMILFFISMALVVDHNLGVFAAIGTSFRIMRGNVLVTFLIWFIICIVGSIGSVVTCGLGYIAFIPFIVLSLSMIYLASSGQMNDNHSSLPAS